MIRIDSNWFIDGFFIPRRAFFEFLLDLLIDWRLFDDARLS